MFGTGLLLLGAILVIVGISTLSGDQGPSEQELKAQGRYADLAGKRLHTGQGIAPIVIGALFAAVGLLVLVL